MDQEMPWGQVGEGGGFSIPLVYYDPSPSSWTPASQPGVYWHGAVTITYSISGQASANDLISSGTYTIPAWAHACFGNYPDIYPGPASLSLPISIARDNLVEGNESLVITLTGATGVGVGYPSPYYPASPQGPATRSFIIADDPPVVTVTKLSDGSEEPESPSTSGTTPVRFRISRTGGDATQPLSVSYSVAGSGDNPTSGGDYSGGSGSVTIPANASFADVQLAVIDDDVVEAAMEELTLTLTNGGVGQNYVFSGFNMVTNPNPPAPAAKGAIQDNDWKISDACLWFQNNQEILFDPGSTYTTPQWFDHDGDGSASTSAGNAAPAPISYRRSTPEEARKITLEVVFGLRGNPIPGVYHIKGTGSITGSAAGGSIGVFEGDVRLARTDADAYCVYGTFTSTGNLPSVISKGALEIGWEVKRIGPVQQERSYGLSANTLYVTANSAPNISETILELACGAADGKVVTSDNDQRQIITAVWSKFSGRSTRRVDGTEMKFSHVDSAGRTAAAMLAHKDGLGQCAAWADLLVQVLTLDGVEAQVQRAAWHGVFVVREVPAQGTGAGPYTDAGTAANPFEMHAVVRTRVVNAIFDPSYGGEPIGPDGANSPEQQWENAFLRYTLELVAGQPSITLNRPRLDLIWDAVTW